MSISSMTNIAAARLDPNVPASGTLSETVKAAAGVPDHATLGTTALSAISSYIPTESVAIYIAALAAARSGASDSSMASGGELVAFWSVLVATPIIVWAVYAAKMRTAGGGIPWFNPPIWEMTAATLGFAAWSYALPDSPWAAFSWYTPASGTLVILVASTALGLGAGVFARSK